MRIDDGKISNISRLEKSEDIEEESKKVDEEVKADILANPDIKKEIPTDGDDETPDTPDDDDDGEV
jgi:hypothetical protein